MRNKLENDLISLGVTIEQLAGLRLEGDSYVQDHPETQPSSSSQIQSTAKKTSEEQMIVDSGNPQDIEMTDPNVVAVGGAIGGPTGGTTGSDIDWICSSATTTII